MKLVGKRLLRNERGFTLVETMIAIVIASVTLVTVFLIINEIDKVDNNSKKLSYAESLIDPYLAYYQDLDVKRSDENVYLSDVSKVNLVDVARKDNKDGVPSNFRDLDVVCVNDPELLKDGTTRYVEFRISCEVDNKKVNKGRPYIIKKLVL